jgi:Flp pilus assembly protein TadG
MSRILHRRLSRPDFFSTEASAIVEFAITLPLLVVFIVGIYDFSGAFDQKLKIDQAAQEGAILAGSQPTTDVESAGSTTPGAGPDSLQAVVISVFNSLTASGVLKGGCSPPGTSVQNALSWTYTILGCTNSIGSTDTLTITINRAVVVPFTGSNSNASPSAAIGTSVNVQYPYHWRFNSAIQLLFPGATYAAVTQVNETATVHNQM